MYLIVSIDASVMILSSAKIVQMSGMKVYFQIAECSLSSAKISKKARNYQVLNVKILSLQI